MATTGWTPVLLQGSAGTREPRNDRINYTYEFHVCMRESDEMQISVSELQKCRLVSSSGRPGSIC
jgi:hypothetical protein